VGPGVEGSLQELAARNWVRRLPDGRLGLTEEGLAAVRDFLRQAEPEAPAPAGSEAKAQGGEAGQ
jgi:hypothetical protein